MVQRVYDVLQTRAQNRDIIFYSELNNICELGLDFNIDADRRELGERLGKISRFEYSNKHPLLSVVAVHKETLRPADPFFDLARKLGVMRADESQEEFFIRCLTETYNYWGRDNPALLP